MLQEPPAHPGRLSPHRFPACPSCPYRWLARPAVCLACLEASDGQEGKGGPEATPAAVSRCASCGAARTPGGGCPTRWCRRPDRGWSVVWGVGAHAGALKAAILRYKYAGEPGWAGVFGRLLAGYLDRHAPWFDDFDLLVPMPAFTGPGARRPWDPVGRMVAELSALTGPLWPVGWQLVVKAAETAPMSGTSRGVRQRRAAGDLRRALRVPHPAAVAGARILVVDDVLAEGSTLREVARALRTAGAREVAGLVLARPPWHGSGGGGSGG